LLLLIPIILIGAGFWAHHQLVATGNPGFLIVGFGQWSIETSFFVGAIALILGFVAFYLLVRLIIGAIRLPRFLKQRGGEQRTRKSQEALLAGLLESAEGNWEKAEKHLIRHAANSGVPLINYLTAARAAQSRGAYDQRDEYLRMAQETMPEAELAIGLTKVELQMSDQQFDQALESLTELNQIAPSHAKVLKLMHQVYAQAEDWEGLSRLIPKLHSNKVMMEAEIKLLETETYSALLKRKSELKDADSLRDAWLNIPEHIRAMSGIQQLYFAAMIEAGAGEEIEPRLRELINRDWGETQLVLYGCIQMADPQLQLETAEKWLPKRRSDGVLLRVLGKLALRADQLEKARDYLQASLDVEPSVESFRLMGDVLLRQNQAVKACLYFRNGLLFAANEAISEVGAEEVSVEGADSSNSDIVAADTSA
jgi:HemY protein